MGEDQPVKLGLATDKDPKVVFRTRVSASVGDIPAARAVVGPPHHERLRLGGNPPRHPLRGLAEPLRQAKRIRTRAHNTPNCDRWMHSHSRLLPKRTAATRLRSGYNASLSGDEATRTRHLVARRGGMVTLPAGANPIGGGIRSRRQGVTRIFPLTWKTPQSPSSGWRPRAPSSRRITTPVGSRG